MEILRQRISINQPSAGISPGLSEYSYRLCTFTSGDTAELRIILKNNSKQYWLLQLFL
jgi:hypothetical protein